MSFNEASLEALRPGVLFCERYRIERHLADGGMNAVFLAIDEQSGLPVAVKVLFPHYSDNAIVRARFLDEGRIQAMLNHPNIVHVYKVITTPVLSFVMEYVEGDTLEDYLQKHEKLSEMEIVDLILPVMSAVGFAHNKGIVHRDLKPSNVLLKKNGGFLEPKVMDFGVAKVTRGKQLTAAGTTVGTLHYMSPEQIVGASNIDGRADIYSLGCSLYKLCTGEVPFNASSEFALMMAQVEAPPTPPRELRPDLSQEMQEIILKALSKEPESRFQTIREMTSALVQLSSPDSPRDTDTRPIPASLLEFAMAADEVALDQTSQYRVETLAIGADVDVDVDDQETQDFEPLNMTHELSTLAVKKIASDRVKAAVRKSKAGIPVVIPQPTSKELDRTQENRIEEMTTVPRDQKEDTDLRATIEASQQGMEPKSLIGDDVATQPVPKKSGKVVVDRPGVDSQDVTNRQIDQASLHRQAISAREDATVDERPSGKGKSLDLDQRETSEQRPSRRVKSLPGREPRGLDDPTVEEVPSRRMPPGRPPRQSTAAERPSQRGIAPPPGISTTSRRSPPPTRTPRIPTSPPRHSRRRQGPAQTLRKPSSLSPSRSASLAASVVNRAARSATSKSPPGGSSSSSSA